MIWAASDSPDRFDLAPPDALDAAARVGDISNMACAGILVTHDAGTAAMVRNGALNRLGAISPLLEETNHFSTPLAENGRCIALVIDTASVVVLALGEGVRAAEDSRSGMQSS